eukprot:g1016.t1
MGRPSVSVVMTMCCCFIAVVNGYSIDSYFAEGTRSFRFRTYTDIVETFKELGRRYPNQTDVFTVQERFGVASPGTCEGVPCEQIVMRITEEASLENDPERPEMFLSGEVHGNERVGPQAVTELAIYLLENYEREVNGDASSDWFTRMLRSRSLLIMPTANALGYSLNQREESGVDPNRDFPYNRDSRCMQTTAARAINEMYRRHLFQLALTYHAGMSAIAYEWGSFNHYAGRRSPESPDDRAQVMLGQRMRSYADHFGNVPFYNQGRMNDLVYPVNGGMEDWAYAASWDTSATTPCQPSTFGGYDASRTSYDSAMLRTFNILIETSNDKTPAVSTLGDTSSDPLDVGGSGDGHVPRNMRLAALLLDVLQPYINLQCPCANFADGNEGTEPPTTQNATSVTFEWEVGGAFEVDSTELHWGSWPSDAEHSLMTPWHAWMEYVMSHNLAAGDSSSNRQNGQTRWGALTDSGAIESFKSVPFEPRFVQELDTRSLWQSMVRANLANPDDDDVDIFVIARATVDSSFATQSQPEPALAPQSHFVNARTNNDWSYELNGHRVKGHSEWWSAPIRIRLLNPGISNETTSEAPSSSGCLTSNGVLCSTPAADSAYSTVGDVTDEPMSSGELDSGYGAGAVLAAVAGVTGVLLIIGFGVFYVRWRTSVQYMQISRNVDTDGTGAVVSVELESRDSSGFGDVVTANAACVADAPRLPAEVERGNIEYKLHLVDPSSDRLDHLVTQMQWRLVEGQSEAIYYIGVEDCGNPKGLSLFDLQRSVETLRRMAKRLGAKVTISSVTRGRASPSHRVARTVVRQSVRSDVLRELRIAVIGGVASGKSTLISVLTTGALDNGRGGARITVLRHQHELENGGSTSAISHHVLGFSSSGEVTNYSNLRPKQNDEIVRESAKLLTFLDLAGHERYLKTTAFGLTGTAPDYALLAIAADAGLGRMTKEHLGIALALKLPVIVVVTKTDVVPQSTVDKTCRILGHIFASSGRGRSTLVVETIDDILQVLRKGEELGTAVIPIFAVSNVTGDRLELLRCCLNLLPMRRDYDRLKSFPAEFRMFDSFHVDRVGTVLAGTVSSGQIRTNDRLLLGPDGVTGQFYPVEITSIESKRVPVSLVSAGQSATMAIRLLNAGDDRGSSDAKEIAIAASGTGETYPTHLSRNLLRKGVVLVDAALEPKAVREFDVDLLLLFHPSGISCNHQMFAHAQAICQTVQIVQMNVRRMRTGHRARCRMRLMYHAEYLHQGSTVFFRDGLGKGVGTILSSHPIAPRDKTTESSDRREGEATKTSANDRTRRRRQKRHSSLVAQNLERRVSEDSLIDEETVEGQGRLRSDTSSSH